ncbi:MAG: hypothetical protein ACTSU4_07725 [Promethearchaeota archaeon]
MTQLSSEKEFLEKLFEVIKKLASIANSQSARFKQKWNGYLSAIQKKPYLIRFIPQPLDQERFFNSLEYRIEILTSVTNALIDGYYTIKNLLQVLYQHYFNNSFLFLHDFSKNDRVMVQYLVAKEILGNLIQYNKMDPHTVPLKYNIIARNYLILKMQGIKLEEIVESMNKLNRNVSKEEVINVMEEIQADGLINIEKKEDTYLYTLKQPIQLSEEGEKVYNLKLRALVEFPTQFYRSFYNIRELNVTPSHDMKFRDFLIAVLPKAATQGFAAAHYVFKNLTLYYEKRKECQHP